MEAENWKKVKELLNEVLEIEISKRQDFWDKANISSEIRAEVESLLAFEDESEELMKISAVEFSKGFFDEDDSANVLIGQNIGIYKIVREIGYGGMGAVYLATRTDGKFDQKVALKLLKREMNTSEIRRRFRQEREILASLEHPNIARLLDAGTTDDKIPYLAMEYVEGLPIDEYCRKNNLDLNQKLDLFREVCGAVNFAHRNLIVHRDLKPSNILVNEDGIPKLLDFGISKILSAEFEQVNSSTVTKLGVMTPSYASPEQLQSKSVTTSTDIYSLGVILYELLSGHRPFEAKENDIKEIYKAVLETEPPPPSAMVSDTKFKILDSEIKTKKLPHLTKDQNIQTVPKSKTQNSKLTGDLDNIVLKSLRKEPERRYLSAENFSEDIKRYLRGLPVTARPNTFAYRVEKFLKRNRLSVIAASLLILAILGGIIATIWQAQIAKAERQKAEIRFNEVRTLANSFIFEFSPKIENLPGSLPARELLVQRAVEYLNNLAKESNNDLELQREIAAAYEKVGDLQGHPYNANIGDTKGAFESYEKSLNIRQNLLDKDPNNIKIQRDLANIYKLVGELHSNGGDYKLAEGFIEKSLVLNEKIVSQNPQDFEARKKLAEILRSRGLIPFYEGDNKKAIEFYSKAKEINEQLFREQPENPKIAEQYFYNFVAIGEAQGWDNDFEGASKPLQTGLDMLIALGAKHPNDLSIQRSLMLAYNKRAENHQDLEEFNKSVELFSKGAAIADNILRADPQSFQAKNDVAMTNKKFAQALNDAGKSKESLEKLIIVLNIFKEMSLADPKNTEYPYNVANTRHSIGLTYMTMKNYNLAIESFEKSNEEFNVILKSAPENVYAQRMSSYNYNYLGKSYLTLSEKSSSQEFIQKSADNFQISLERFKKMKADGNLGEVDSKIIGETEAEIEKVKSKINRN